MLLLLDAVYLDETNGMFQFSIQVGVEMREELRFT